MKIYLAADYARKEEMQGVRDVGKGQATVSKWTFFAMMLGAIYTGLVVTDDLIRAGFGSVILAIIIWFVQTDRATER